MLIFCKSSRFCNKSIFAFYFNSYFVIRLYYIYVCIRGVQLKISQSFMTSLLCRQNYIIFYEFRASLIIDRRAFEERFQYVILITTQRTTFSVICSDEITFRIRYGLFWRSRRDFKFFFFFKKKQTSPPRGRLF